MCSVHGCNMALDKLDVRIYDFLTKCVASQVKVSKANHIMIRPVNHLLPQASKPSLHVLCLALII